MIDRNCFELIAHLRINPCIGWNDQEGDYVAGHVENEGSNIKYPGVLFMIIQT